MQGPALAARRAKPATTELCPSLDTAFSVSFCTAALCLLFIKSNHFDSSPRICCSVVDYLLNYYDPMVSFQCSFCCCFFPLLSSVDILLNRSQQLFASCTAKFADGQQCSIPVFDITHQTPLCEEHAKKMVSLVSNGKLWSILGNLLMVERWRKW